MENHDWSIQRLEPAELHTATRFGRLFRSGNPIQNFTFFRALINLKNSRHQLKHKPSRIKNSTTIMSSSSRPLVLYEGAERQVSDVLAEVRGFAVNRRRAALVQICDEILLSRENYADATSVVVNFISYNNGL